MIDAVRGAIWPRLEPALIDAGREGELIVARARLVIMPVLLASPVATLLRNPVEAPAWMAVVTGVLYLALAAVFLDAARERAASSRLGFASSIIDISFVTAYHAMLFVDGFSVMALTSRATFSLYLIAISATSLRYDGRITTLAGLVAGLQWLSLVGWAETSGNAAAALADGRFYGDIDLAGQAEELIMIAAATGLAHLIIGRGASLRLSSVRDGLTGLMNRSHFEERLESELLRARRHRRPLTVALLDLDVFKYVNDTFGHPAGDRVLKEVAARLTASVRRTDLVARLGGDEFAVLLADTNGAEVAQKLEAIRQAISSRPIRVREGVEVTVTASAGMAVAPADSYEAPVLVNAADMRLLEAKQMGRDRLVASSAP